MIRVELFQSNQFKIVNLFDPNNSKPRYRKQKQESYLYPHFRKTLEQLLSSFEANLLFPVSETDKMNRIN